jgi:hypothetical protein
VSVTFLLGYAIRTSSAERFTYAMPLWPSQPYGGGRSASFVRSASLRQITERSIIA